MLTLSKGPGLMYANAYLQWTDPLAWRAKQKSSRNYYRGTKEPDWLLERKVEVNNLVFFFAVGEDYHSYCRKYDVEMA